MSDTFLQNPSVPVIAIDGSTATGKGTARHNVARMLGFRELDSGAFYRVVGWKVYRRGIDVSDLDRVLEQTQNMNVHVEGVSIFFNGCDCTAELRSEKVSEFTPLIAKIPEVRRAVLMAQLNMRLESGGLVADGRDMGQIFNPSCRFFLTANLTEVARRRVRQLHDIGEEAEYESVLQALRLRDEIDRTRAVSPLECHPLATVIDTTRLSRSEVAETIIQTFMDKGQAFAA